MRREIEIKAAVFVFMAFFFIKNPPSVSEERKRPGPLGPGSLQSEGGSPNSLLSCTSKNALAFYEFLIGLGLRLRIYWYL